MGDPLKTCQAFLLGLSWLALAPAASAQAAADLFLGTWALDTAASHYSSGATPRRMLITMTETPEGVSYHSEATLEDGRSMTAQYVADYSGDLAMVVGDAGMLVPVSVKRLDAYTVEATYIRGFRAVALSRRVVSPDGHLMTITTTSVGQPGPALANVGVYTRVTGAQ